MVLEHPIALRLVYSKGRTEISFFAQPEEVAENNGNVYPAPSSPPQDVVAIRKRCSNPKCRQSNVTIAKEMPSSGIIKFLVNSSKNILLRRFIA